MPYQNKEQQKEFQRRWCQKRRALWLAIFANQCWTCGSEKNLDFDHIDPKTKITLAQLNSSPLSWPNANCFAVAAT